MADHLLDFLSRADIPLFGTSRRQSISVAPSALHACVPLDFYSLTLWFSNWICPWLNIIDKQTYRELRKQMSCRSFVFFILFFFVNKIARTACQTAIAETSVCDYGQVEALFGNRTVYQISHAAINQQYLHEIYFLLLTFQKRCLPFSLYDRHTLYLLAKSKHHEHLSFNWSAHHSVYWSVIPIDCEFFWVLWPLMNRNKSAFFLVFWFLYLKLFYLFQCLYWKSKNV